MSQSNTDAALADNRSLPSAIGILKNPIWDYVFDIPFSSDVFPASREP